MGCILQLQVHLQHAGRLMVIRNTLGYNLVFMALGLVLSP